MADSRGSVGARPLAMMSAFSGESIQLSLVSMSVPLISCSSRNGSAMRPGTGVPFTLSEGPRPRTMTRLVGSMSCGLTRVIGGGRVDVDDEAADCYVVACADGRSRGNICQLALGRHHADAAKQAVVFDHPCGARDSRGKIQCVRVTAATTIAEA